MKTQEQIEAILQAFELELDNLKDWVNKAHENYKKDKAMWGNEADDGEWRYANDEYNKVNQKVKMLKWILSDETTDSTTNPNSMG